MVDAWGNKTGGRKKGTLNKYNADIRDMVITALNQAGGVEYLRKQAYKNPVAFMGLVGRTLPTQITGKDGDSLKIEISIRKQKQEALSVLDAAFTEIVTEITADDHEEDEIEWPHQMLLADASSPNEEKPSLAEDIPPIPEAAPLRRKAGRPRR